MDQEITRECSKPSHCLEEGYGSEWTDPGDWPDFSALSNNRYHCHLKKGHPTYVAIWEVRSKEIRLIEVTYAGTHEKAPY